MKLLAPSSSTVVLLSLALIVLLAGSVAKQTAASFRDQATVTTSTFTAGIVDVRLANGINSAADNVTGSLTFSAMTPGDFRAQALTVTNNGDIPFSYTLSGSVTNTGGLDSQLQFQVVTVVSVATCAGASGFIAGSAVVYPAPPAPTPGTLAGANGAIIGSGTARTVNAGSTEILCLEIALPPGSGTAYQSTTANIDLTFTATQIVVGGNNR